MVVSQQGALDEAGVSSGSLMCIRARAESGNAFEYCPGGAGLILCLIRCYPERLA